MAGAKLLTGQLDFVHQDVGALRRHPDVQSRAKQQVSRSSRGKPTNSSDFQMVCHAEKKSDRALRIPLCFERLSATL
jgi:hypothetical protein